MCPAIHSLNAKTTPKSILKSLAPCTARGSASRPRQGWPSANAGAPPPLRRSAQFSDRGAGRHGLEGHGLSIQAGSALPNDFGARSDGRVLHRAERPQVHEPGTRYRAWCQHSYASAPACSDGDDKGAGERDKQTTRTTPAQRPSPLGPSTLRRAALGRQRQLRGPAAAARGGKHETKPLVPCSPRFRDGPKRPGIVRRSSNEIA